MKTTPQASKSAVLHAFSVEANSNADTLATYLKCYPQFRESLIDLSIELFTAHSFEEKSIETVPSDNAKRAWSTFQSMLKPEDPASAVASTIDNPLSSLSNQQFRELAKELNVNRLFLSQLRDCSVYVATIPQKFLVLLANLLNIPVEELQQALNAPPTIATAQRYKAAGKPDAGNKITFEEAMTHSQLSDEQKSALREMKD